MPTTFSNLLWATSLNNYPACLLPTTLLTWALWCFPYGLDFLPSSSMIWMISRSDIILCNPCKQVFAERRVKRPTHCRGNEELLILLHTLLPAEDIHFPSSQCLLCIKADLTWFNWRGGPHLCRDKKSREFGEKTEQKIWITSGAEKMTQLRRDRGMKALKIGDSELPGLKWSFLDFGRSHCIHNGKMSIY